MSTKKTKPAEEYLTLKVEDVSISVETSINPQVRESRHKDDRTSLFDYGSSIELMGICTSPTDRAGDRFHIDIYKNELSRFDFDTKLRDVHIKDDDGLPKYRKVRGRVLPVYDIPEGITLITRKRGPVDWDGVLWIPDETITQMLIVLTRMQHPLYLRIHERKIDRTRWLDGLSLHTSDPTDE